MMKVVLTAEAKADVAREAGWYRERSVRAAEEFLLAVGAALVRIEAQPTSQVVVDVSTGARRALLRKFPHRVLYLIDARRVVVFAVVHKRRDKPVWHERLEQRPMPDADPK